MKWDTADIKWLKFWRHLLWKFRIIVQISTNDVIWVNVTNNTGLENLSMKSRVMLVQWCIKYILRGPKKSSPWHEVQGGGCTSQADNQHPPQLMIHIKTWKNSLFISVGFCCVIFPDPNQSKTDLLMLASTLTASWTDVTQWRGTGHKSYTHS